MAVAMGTDARYLTNQFETASSEPTYSAIAAARATNGTRERSPGWPVAASTGPAPGSRRPNGIGVMARTAATGKATTPVPAISTRQLRPVDSSCPITNGATSAPMLKKTCRRLSAPPRASRYRSRNRLFTPPSIPPPPQLTRVDANSSHVHAGATASAPKPTPSARTLSGSTMRRPMRSVRAPLLQAPKA